jgi:hypothetical protein
MRHAGGLVEADGELVSRCGCIFVVIRLIEI